MLNNSGFHAWHARMDTQTRSHTGRGCISGEKRDRERNREGEGERERKKGGVGNAPLFVFLSWWDNPSTLASNQPALWHKNTTKTSDPCECASYRDRVFGLLLEVNSCLGRFEPKPPRTPWFFSADSATHKITRLQCKHAFYSPRSRPAAPVWAAVWKSTKIAINEMTMPHDFRKGFSR